MILLEILGTLLQASGLIMIAIGTVGILGYKLFVQLKTRKNAIIMLFAGFAFIYVSGVINTAINPSVSTNSLVENEENISNQNTNNTIQTTTSTTISPSSIHQGTKPKYRSEIVQQNSYKNSISTMILEA